MKRNKAYKHIWIKNKVKKNKLPLKIKGNSFLRPIYYFEEKGSAQVKSCIMLSALNTFGETTIKCKKSRDHTEKLFKYLKLPIKICKNSPSIKPFDMSFAGSPLLNHSFENRKTKTFFKHSFDKLSIMEKVDIENLKIDNLSISGHSTDLGKYEYIIN